MQGKPSSKGLCKFILSCASQLNMAGMVNLIWGPCVNLNTLTSTDKVANPLPKQGYNDVETISLASPQCGSELIVKKATAGHCRVKWHWWDWGIGLWLSGSPSSVCGISLSRAVGPALGHHCRQVWGGRGGGWSGGGVYLKETLLNL